MLLAHLVRNMTYEQEYRATSIHSFRIGLKKNVRYAAIS